MVPTIRGGEVGNTKQAVQGKPNVKPEVDDLETSDPDSGELMSSSGATAQQQVEAVAPPEAYDEEELAPLGAKEPITRVLPEPVPAITQSKPAGPTLETCAFGQESKEAEIVFVRICSGTFIMGFAQNDPRGDDDEKPAHQVTLSEFWISKTEVTNEQYRRFLPDHQGEARLPASSVSWFDAKAACEFFGGRLPTEAEWEYAARAGSQAFWSFGDDEEMLDQYSWNANNTDVSHRVGTKGPNAWGLHDMYGNVAEWVSDWYGIYSGSTQTDPLGPAAGKRRVVRGGSFEVFDFSVCSARRHAFQPEVRYLSVGFRCARSPHR